MIRRTVLATAAAVAVVLAPTAAMAYESDEFTAVVSDPTPAAGAPVTVTVEGEPNALVSLMVQSDDVPDSAIEIAGSRTLSKSTNASGVAVFTVTLSQNGAYTATAKDAAGNIIKVQDLSVVGAAGAAAGTSASRAAQSRGGLAETGFDGAGLAAGAGALVVAGAGAVLIAKRRQSASI
jgi:hypothetical protein